MCVIGPIAKCITFSRSYLRGLHKTIEIVGETLVPELAIEMEIPIRSRVSINPKSRSGAVEKRILVAALHAQRSIHQRPPAEIPIIARSPAIEHRQRRS